LKDVAREAPPLSGRNRERCDAALARLRAPAALDVEEAEKRLAAMLGPLA